MLTSSIASVLQGLKHTVEMAKNQIANSPEARQRTQAALAELIKLYDRLGPQEKEFVKRHDEMTALLLERECILRIVYSTERYWGLLQTLAFGLSSPNLTRCTTTQSMQKQMNPISTGKTHLPLHAQLCIPFNWLC